MERKEELSPSDMLKNGTWFKLCGALQHNGFQTDIHRILREVFPRSFIKSTSIATSSRNHDLRIL